LRHSEAAHHLYSKLEAGGLEMIVDSKYRLPPLTLVRIPDGVDDASVRRSLLDNRNIELGGGLGKFAGKAWRVGLMGQNATIERADLIASSLLKEL
jgi:alanine-glyoxylate transaminase/serine-glyoxylate transaminase/serine-pyruvate transaminase